MRWRIYIALMCVLPILIGCGASTGPTYPSAGSNTGYGNRGDAGRSADNPTPEAPDHGTTGRLQPADVSYIGAFRLPEESGGSNWEYSGDAATWCPTGDPDGPDDGFPGSLYAVGHSWDKQISEVTIPEPTPAGNSGLEGLNRAETLQSFTDVRAGVGQFDVLREMLTVGMAYLPAQGSQTSDKLHLCFGQHLQEEEQRVPSHMWCELDLTGAAGAWQVGNENIYAVNDYMFDIPQSWAAENVGGMRLATGRFRDGGWSGQGPSLFAIAPWQQGNPPPDGAVLETVALLRYDSTSTDDEPWTTMNGYHHSDEWSGGAWLTSSNGGAVVFVGTRGTGECWYGLPDGTEWPDEPPYPDDPTGERGWWSTGFEAQMPFYDPADLAAVARGEMTPDQPQPYATMDLTDALLRGAGAQEKHQVGACAFGRDNGVLYVIEPRADGDRSVIHAWRVGEEQPQRADM